MRILVGILHTIENEFKQCISSIEEQTHQDFEYFVIENLPNKEAHDTLYQTFMDRAEAFDLFIKVDADMVLARSTFFEEVTQEMQRQQDVDHFEIGLWDFFTDQIIYGLHVYRNTVTWNLDDGEQLFVDKVEHETNKVVYLDEEDPLVPAAKHCPNPSLFQSFHFGLHKSAKVLQEDSMKRDIISAQSHLNKIIDLANNYKQNKKDQRLQYAVIGVFWGFSNKIGKEDVDFNAEKSNIFFKELTHKSKTAKEKYISRNFWKYMLFLPRNIWLLFMLFLTRKSLNLFITLNLLKRIPKAFVSDAKNLFKLIDQNRS